MRSLFQAYTNPLKKLQMLALVVALPLASIAQGPPKESELSNPLAQVLIVIIFGLLLAIGLLANVVMGAAGNFLQRYQTDQKSAKALPIIAILLLSSLSVMAQDAAPAEATASVTHFAGLSAYTFYSLIAVIGLELLIMFFLLYNLKRLLSAEKTVITGVEATAPKKETSWQVWWDKANSFRPMKEEAQIDLGHNYDGIRELDNRLPPWWLYGFYVTIVFAGIYLWRYHVVHSAPLSQEELQIALEMAEKEKEAYLKLAANKVDENTVVYLEDATAMLEGKKIYAANCAACHGPDGGGTVGPNFTDDYWLHGGSIQDIFKTVKYGVPEKGMKSWKDDLSPVQIAQVSSFIKSLKGTKATNPKEPQGELYAEPEAAPATPPAQ